MRCISLAARAKALLKIWRQGRVMLLPLYQPVKNTKRLTVTFIFFLLLLFCAKIHKEVVPCKYYHVHSFSPRYWQETEAEPRAWK